MWQQNTRCLIEAAERSVPAAVSAPTVGAQIPAAAIAAIVVIQADGSLATRIGNPSTHPAKPVRVIRLGEPQGVGPISDPGRKICHTRDKASAAHRRVAPTIIVIGCRRAQQTAVQIEVIPRWRSVCALGGKPFKGNQSQGGWSRVRIIDAVIPTIVVPIAVRIAGNIVHPAVAVIVDPVAGLYTHGGDRRVVVVAVLAHIEPVPIHVDARMHLVVLVVAVTLAGAVPVAVVVPRSQPGIRVIAVTVAGARSIVIRILGRQ